MKKIIPKTREQEIHQLKDRLSEARTHASYRVVERIAREFEQKQTAGDAA